MKQEIFSWRNKTKWLDETNKTFDNYNNFINLTIYKTLIDSVISHGEFVLINNIRKWKEK